MRSKTTVWLFAMLLILALITAACDAPSGTAPSASSLLPNLGGYSVVEGQSVQEFITGLGETAGGMSLNPAMIAAIAAVDQVIDCYRDVGAVDFRLYSKDDFPTVAGVVAITNRDLLLDPQTFLRCVGLDQATGAGEGQGGGVIQPCFHSYSPVIEDDTFDIIYAGTDLEICQAFCGALPECAGHR